MSLAEVGAQFHGLKIPVKGGYLDPKTKRSGAPLLLHTRGGRGLPMYTGSSVPEKVFATCRGNERINRCRQETKREPSIVTRTVTRKGR